MQSEPIHADAVYSREQAAELLGVSLSTVKRLIATGALEASRPDGLRRVFVRGDAILRMLDQTRISARPQARA